MSFGCAPENVEKLKKAVFDEIKAVQADGSFQRLTAAMPNQLVAWQERSKDCEAGFIVPVRNITWGRVKSLYR